MSRPRSKYRKFANESDWLAARIKILHGAYDPDIIALQKNFPYLEPLDCRLIIGRVRKAENAKVVKSECSPMGLLSMASWSTPKDSDFFT